MYNLIPPSHIPPQQRAAWVEEAAMKLLKDGIFLCNGVDNQGKTENASHPVLREAAISFFYTGSYCVTCRRPEVFQKSLLLESLALVCTVVFSMLLCATNNTLTTFLIGQLCPQRLFQERQWKIISEVQHKEIFLFVYCYAR
jgi:hypothetical protein